MDGQLYNKLKGASDIPKIHVEKLIIDARKWWDSLRPEQQDNYILTPYMHANKISDDDVQW